MCSPQPVVRTKFMPAVGYALDVLLHVLFPAVGYALSSLLHVFALLLGMLFSYPLWVRSFLPAVGPLFSTRCGSALLASCHQDHPSVRAHPVCVLTQSAG